MLPRIAIVSGLVLSVASWIAPARAIDDQNCEDFDSQAAAQSHLRSDPTDPDALDADNDGVACSVTSYANTARDTTPVGQVSTTSTTVAGATTSTTAVVLPTTVADTGAFSAPLFGAGVLLVGIGLSFKGKRAKGAHFTP